MSAKNWTKLFENYKGQWVALKDDETTVISSGMKLADVIRVAADKGYTKPILTKVPKKNVVYIGSL
jgi:hypothetical protein